MVVIDKVSIQVQRMLEIDSTLELFPKKEENDDYNLEMNKVVLRHLPYPTMNTYFDT